MPANSLPPQWPPSPLSEGLTEVVQRPFRLHILPYRMYLYQMYVCFPNNEKGELFTLGFHIKWDFTETHSVVMATRKAGRGRGWLGRGRQAKGEKWGHL